MNGRTDYIDTTINKYPIPNIPNYIKDSNYIADNESEVIPWEHKLCNFLGIKIKIYQNYT